MNLAQLKIDISRKELHTKFPCLLSLLFLIVLYVIVESTNLQILEKFQWSVNASVTSFLQHFVNVQSVGTISPQQFLSSMSWEILFCISNYQIIMVMVTFCYIYVGRSTLVGQRPMKSLSSVCLSICPSLRPLLSYLKIRLLVFSDILHDNS